MERVEADPNKWVIDRRDLVNTLNELSDHISGPIGIFYIGVDRIKEANQACGLSFGDYLLWTVLTRIKETCLPNSLISRSMGDQFIVAIPAVNTKDEANRQGETLQQSLNRAIKFDGIEWNMTVSIGVSFFTIGGDSWETIEQAHTAMYKAKNGVRDRLSFYDIHAENNAKESLKIEQALKHAIENNELSLQYQPIIDLHNHSIFGAEALLRWSSPELGCISPDRFIPIAEKSDLILDIGFWVFQTVCSHLDQWGNQYTGSIAVNLSAHQVQYHNLANTLLSILDEYGIPINRIHLEITETAMINDTNSALSVVSSLRAAGFTISIDDFGTGYSSLSYLTRFSIDKLKVDRSFVETITTHTESLVVTKSIINLAKSLGMKVVAEGVETDRQLSELSFLDCNYAQGYLFSRPLPDNAFIHFYNSWYSSVEMLTTHLLSEEQAS